LPMVWNLCKNSLNKRGEREIVQMILIFKNS